MAAVRRVGSWQVLCRGPERDGGAEQRERRTLRPHLLLLARTNGKLLLGKDLLLHNELLFERLVAQTEEWNQDLS